MEIDKREVLENKIIDYVQKKIDVSQVPRDILSQMIEDELIQSQDISEVVDCLVEKLEQEQKDLQELNFDDFANMDGQDAHVASFYLYLQDVGRFTVLNDEKQKFYMSKIKEGDLRYKQSFIEHNLRLVIYVAKGYVGRGLDFMDLVQEGNIGLMKAIDKFDPSVGSRFSTYAIWWIRQSIARAIADQARNVRLPVHVVDKLNHLLYVSKEFMKKNSREPSLKELSELNHMSEEDVLELLKLQSDTVSIQTLIGDTQDGDTLEHYISDKEVDFNQNIEFEELHQAILKAIECGKLTEKEKNVLYMRFGLGEYSRPYSLNEIGESYDVTRERVRQIESRALKKIRYSSHIITELAHFFDDPSGALKQITEIKGYYADNPYATKAFKKG